MWECYLTPYRGTGQPFVDPFEPVHTFPGLNYGSLDLRPDPRRRAGWALVALPQRQGGHTGTYYLGSTQDADRPSPAVRRLLQSRLGVSLRGNSLRTLVPELVLDQAHAGRLFGKRPLTATDGMYDIYLGDPVTPFWTAPAVHASAPAIAGLLGASSRVWSRRAWLTGVVALGLVGWPRLARAVSLSDNWNRADNASLGANWTEVGTGWEILGNQCVALNNVYGYAVHVTQLCSNDMFAQIGSFTFIQYTGSNCCWFVWTVVRSASASDANRYHWVAENNNSSVKQHRLAKVVSTTESNLGTDTTIPATGVAEKGDAVGTTIRGLIGGTQKVSVTDSAIDGVTVGGRYVGLGCSLGIGGQEGDTDDWSGGDTGACATTGAPFRALMGVGQ